MDTIVRAWIPSSIEPYLRPLYRELKNHAGRVRRYVDRRTLSEDAFWSMLPRLGIVSGATVFLHTSMDEIARRIPSLTPMRLIQILQAALGETGTLVMPTFPFRGKQFDYAQVHRTFDVRHTASQVGLLTEVFRRMDGVARSAHPTHPVAAWGRHALDLTATHHLGTTFGKTSPFYKLRLVDGCVVGIGTRLESYTILHVADELHELRRERVFSAPIPAIITNVNERIPYEVRPLRPDASRNMHRVERGLLQRHALTYVSIAGLRCSTGTAEQIIRASMNLIDEGRFL